MIAQRPDPARSRALLIGTSQYADGALSPIPGVVNNLTCLAAVLTSPQGAGLPREHCRVIRDPPAQDAVGDQITELAGEATDTLLIYYAGHGVMTWDRHNELCLAMRNTRVRSLRTSSLRCEDLRQYILASRAKVRVLILDCCFAARGIEPTMSDAADVVLGQVDVSGAYVLAATYKEALAPRDQPHTLFTAELLRLLTEGVPVEGELLTLHALAREVRSTMLRKGRPVPASNNSNTAGYLAIGYNAAHTIGRALGEARTGLASLTGEEAATDLAYSTAIDKIDKPDLPAREPVASALRASLAVLDRLAVDGQVPSEHELERLIGDLREAIEETRRLRDVALGLVERRDRLRGRLDGLQAMAVAHGIAEEPELVWKHTVAYDRLWTKPCNLDSADRAVGAYQQAIAKRRRK